MSVECTPIVGSNTELCAYGKVAYLKIDIALVHTFLSLGYLCETYVCFPSVLVADKVDVLCGFRLGAVCLVIKLYCLRAMIVCHLVCTHARDCRAYVRSLL